MEIGSNNSTIYLLWLKDTGILAFLSRTRLNNDPT